MKSLNRWLLYRFFPDVSDFMDPSVRTKVGVFEGWLSTIANVIIFVIKLIIALAINSIALLADAFHSLLDSLSSLVIIFTFKVSQKPPDQEHPYGHGRAEYIATLILSMLIVVTGVEFIRSSVGRITSPAISSSTMLMIGVVVGTAVVKEVLARISSNLGSLIDSDTLMADAWHHRTDAFSSLAPLLSMVLANVGRQQWDGILGTIVGLFIIWTGYTVGRRAIDSLLGKPPTHLLIKRIKRIATEAGEILNVHDIIVHSYGSTRFISLHLETDEEASQLEAHDIAESTMKKLEEELRANVTVHVDPVTTKGEKAEQIKTVLDGLVVENPSVDSYHDFRLVQSGDHNMILLDLFVDAASSEDDQRQLRKRFMEFLQKQFPEFQCRINVVLPVH